MLTFHSEYTKSRRAKVEIHGGEIVPPLECPERVDLVLAGIRKSRLGEVREPQAYGLAPVLAIHATRYVQFIEHAWDDWIAAGYGGEPIPTIWPGRHLRQDVVPSHINGALGYYALAGETAISAGTFEAAQASKDVALAATDHVLDTGQAAFGLCRPPGHHATTDQYGGYCFFNNAAIAAQHALDRGATRIAILDVDYHHGNGTQDIFYARDDVFFASIHADPRFEFPYYLGFADETGYGRGEGFNINYPLPSGTDYDEWSIALGGALREIRKYAPDLLVISLGVDTFEGDPLGKFRLKSGDYADLGKRISRCGIPTVFLLEGGYAVEEIGMNVVNVLMGFDG